MKTNKIILVPTILCGGAGSRLWPVSRAQHPKPFIRLPDGNSFLQHAFLRGVALPCVKEVLTVASRDLLFMVEDEYRELLASDEDLYIQRSFILEPMGRNTAPAIAAACLDVAAKHGEDALLLILAADHLIADQEAFSLAVSEACDLAVQGKIVTFGIKPSRPETGYGYIEADGQQVVRFVEKPSMEKAKEYLQKGTFYWNSGMFCFSAGTMLAEMAKYCPDILKKTQSCLDDSHCATGDGFSRIELDSKGFEVVPSDSIDYAVMEKTTNAAVVVCDIGWSDIGCWKALGELTPPDSHGNRIEGQVMLEDSRNCTVHSNNRLVGTVGVDDLVIVDTADALLVAHKDSVQDVRNIYTRLKNQGSQEHEFHQTVCRPWGSYTVLEDAGPFKIKRIEVKKGASLSLQMHHHRSEHWIVVSGSAKVINGADEIVLNANQSTYIHAGLQHRLENVGEENLVLIEVQTGSYLGEDDIVRYQDIYGRVPCVS